jgi:SecD/SecF fusion protein
MQLKGLVRFFTILLILYSIYELSFTWVVRNHEKKMEASAKNFARANYGSIPKEEQDRVYKDRLKRLLDSTKDNTVHYGIGGAISYQQAKENELNLGLDLQGGINVTMEVELSGLLRSMANNSKDPNFLKALDNANRRKANSDADYITLFVDEYKKLNPGGRLASLFASGNNDRIKITDNDDQVITALRRESGDAFDRTYRVLRSRIDQFGVAQPNINPDRDKGIITVELPGIQDQERVRRYLQSSANLQFWEVYNISELGASVQKADEAFNVLMGGKTTADTTATLPAPTDTTRQDTATAGTTDTSLAGLGGLDTAQAATQKGGALNRRSLGEFIQFSIDPRTGQPYDNGQIGYVQLKDTAMIRSYLENPAVRSHFPADLRFMYGIPDVINNKKANFVALYGIKTYGNEKAKLEGEAVVEARQDYNPTTGGVEVSMRMNPTGARVWEQMTKANKGRSIAIVLDEVVYSAPKVNDVISGGNSSISGNFSEQEGQDLANI